MKRLHFSPALPRTPAFTLGDGLIILAIATLLYIGARLAFRAPEVVAGPSISLSAKSLPWYVLLSTGRMLAAYLLSLIFSLAYGYAAARRRSARVVLMPLLDVLQSVPILSFLPVVLLSLTAIMPQAAAAEIAAIVLIFTSQAWNMTFSFYQSLNTIPVELREATSIFRLNAWLRFRTLELPFSAIGLLWNSMMSWSGGWFFLMAAEIFHVGARDFRLPGIGSYLQTAADRGNVPAVLLGVAALIFTILVVDQLVWRPLTAWVDRFKLEMVEGDEPHRSWFLDVISRSWILARLNDRVWAPFSEALDRVMGRLAAREPATPVDEPVAGRPSARFIVTLTFFSGLVIYGAYRAALLLVNLDGRAWGELGVSLLATLARVMVALAISLAWTIPVGVAIGTNRRVAQFLQPVVQVTAAIPATALFPVILLAVIGLPGGLNLAAVLLMLLGTQWYLLFNVIAGASSIPLDLRYTTDLLRLSRRDRWRTLILPALFPYIVTGAITASGGAWNASIVAEHATFGGVTRATVGVGALIAAATARGDYPMLLAGTLALVVTVVLINRTFWLRLYRLAEERYRME